MTFIHVIISVLIFLLIVPFKKRRKTENNTEFKQGKNIESFEINLTPSELEKEFKNLDFTGGTLRFWGNWFGRPMDNFHVVKNIEFIESTERIILSLDDSQKITIIKPRNISITNKELNIEEAENIRFEWSYFINKKKVTKFQSYQKLENKIKFDTNIDSSKKYIKCTINKPALSIIGM
ncbi:hypothetical protein QVZ41_13920 [Wenyingzhuangia sp. chi5]|uniref:Uncharacterized protein n=1 Tax=Wenyingzhuangia gilva TaxID=3057677 RepID=A0ABT8VVD6_9FLAO|nr:hypothetical protein [Wenyingzhuangia sp. chi5]MDO3695944.1 hypothetical protein [Wenyingzhuangia sp. chi5]